MICGKQIYRSRTEARAAIQGINSTKIEVSESTVKYIAKKMYRSGKVPNFKKRKNKKACSMLTYYCEECKGWHTTTAGKNKRKRISDKNTTVNITSLKNKKDQRDGKLIIRNYK